MKDGKFSHAITFPDDLERTKKELTDSYGNPINDPFTAGDSATEASTLTSKKSGIFVIPGYASGLLTDPVPQKPEQRSQSGFAPDQLLPPADKPSVDNRNQRPSVILPSFDLVAPPPEGNFPANDQQNSFIPPPPPPTPNANFFPANNQQNTFNPAPSPPSFSTNFIPTGISPDGPIIITEVGDFAPRPADGLLPPKDDSELEPSVLPQRPNIFATSPTFPNSPETTVTVIPGKYSGGFGGSSGVLGATRKPISSNSIAPPPQVLPTQQAQAPVRTSTSDDTKYTGGFGGNQGVLSPPSINFLPPPVPQETFIPVAQPDEPQPIPSTSLLAPILPPDSVPADRSQIPATSQLVPPQPTTNTGRYTGGFGGSQGVLGQNRPATSTNAISTTRASFTTPPAIQTTTFNPIPSRTNNNPGKYTGGFGGSSGVLQSNFKPTGLIPTIQTDLQAPLESRIASSPPLTQVPTGFGGAPGILNPFDSKKS